ASQYYEYNEHLANVDYFTDEEGDIENGINTGTNSEIASLITNNSEKETSVLFTGKILANWAICDSFIIDWSRKKGFNVIKDRVHRENNIIRRRTYVCEHGQHYESNSSKETGSKKILCPWHINASCPKLKNPNLLVFINKIIDTHNHELSIDAIIFEQEKNLVMK
ncbi:8310_t:CDS:1, partial [Gigaspora margarita]